MKLLSVDDSLIVRKIIKGASDILEFELLEAEDGNEGLEVLEKNYEDISLILLDWNMPGMDGYSFLKIIKADDKFKDIPVMMVTTESEQENIVKAIKAGAKHYMIKPFSMEELIKRVLECLGRGGEDEF